jgi:hypothetical protein
VIAEDKATLGQLIFESEAIDHGRDDEEVNGLSFGFESVGVGRHFGIGTRTNSSSSIKVKVWT